MFFLDSINTILVIVFFIEIFLLLAMTRVRERNNQILFYSLNVITILFWVVSLFFYRNPELNTDLWVKILYLSGLYPGLTFFFFTLSYPRDRIEKYKNIIYALVAIYSYAGYICITTNYFISSAYSIQGNEPIIYFGSHYTTYIALILIPFVLGFVRLLYFLFRDATKEIKIVFWGYLLASQVGLISNLTLPWVGNFSYNWLGQIATLVMIGSTTYAIVRYNLLNIKLFFVDIIAFTIALFSLVQFLFNLNSDRVLINLSAFIASLVAGYIIISISRKERSTIEEIKSVNQQLEQTNTKLKTLDERKTEFINIASHQLRTPVTAIKGYVGLMRDGVYGQMDDKVGQQVGRIDELSDQVLRLITDMLNISRIEENRLIYRFEKQNPNTIIHSICKSFEPQTDKKGLTFTYTIAEDDVKCEIDRTLFAQCIENILDNALKYTKREGKIEVKTFTKNKKFYFVCRDNGIGIDKESLNVLFTKFSRSKNAVDAGIDGTGIGMYLAQEIMKAHKGTVTLESDGEGKGTTATLSIDL